MNPTSRLRIRARWERFTEPLAERVGAKPKEIMEAVVTGDAYYPFVRGEIDPFEFHRRMEGLIGADVAVDRFFEAWTSIIVPNEEIRGLVGELHGRCRLVVASNTDVLHYERSVETQPALILFEESILSYELGYCKPDTAFFSLGRFRTGSSDAPEPLWGIMSSHRQTEYSILPRSCGSSQARRARVPF